MESVEALKAGITLHADRPARAAPLRIRRNETELASVILTKIRTVARGRFPCGEREKTSNDVSTEKTQDGHVRVTSVSGSLQHSHSATAGRRLTGRFRFAT